MEPDSARPHRFTVLPDAIWRSEYSIMTPRYSFIIPAYNEQAVIASTIDAIHQAAVSLEGAFEITVVNDASTDCTAQIAREKGAALSTFISVRSQLSEMPGRKWLLVRFLSSLTPIPLSQRPRSGNSSTSLKTLGSWPVVPVSSSTDRLHSVDSRLASFSLFTSLRT